MKRIRHISKQSNPAEKRRSDFRDKIASRAESFLVPGNYFDELPQRIMDRISADAQKKQENPQPLHLLRRVWIATAAVAAIAVIFMMTQIVPTANSPILNSNKAANLSADYDQTYADEAMLLEENEITDKDVSAIDFETIGIALSSSDTTSVTTEEIIKYLLDENYDSGLLAEL